jgi:VanZ family protein
MSTSLWTGQSVLNTAYYASIEAELAAIDVCEVLQEVEAEVMALIQNEVNSILANLAYLEPLLALLEIPTLDTIITWVTNFITYFIKPYLQPYITYIQQLTALETQIVTIVNAIESAYSRIGQCVMSSIPSITFSIPAVPAGL